MDRNREEGKGNKEGETFEGRVKESELGRGVRRTRSKDQSGRERGEASTDRRTKIRTMQV